MLATPDGSRSFLLVALVLASASGCSNEPPIRPDAATVAVRSEVVKEGDFQATLGLLGKVRPAETLSIVTPESGTLRYGKAFAEGFRNGARVASGQVLFHLENEPIRLAAAEARLEADSARAERERVERGYRAGIVPEVEFVKTQARARLAEERLRSAEKRVERLTVHAVRTGRLAVSDAHLSGVEVAAGVELARIAVDGAPRIEGWVAAVDRDRLRRGLPANVTRPADPEKEWDATLVEISPIVDEAGTVRVVATIETAEDFPRLGEGVEVTVELASRRGVLTVPEEALVVSAGGSSVYLLEPYGRLFTVRQTSVQTGERGGGRVEITSGLRAGDRIAVAGVSMLATGVFASEAPAAPKSAEGDDDSSSDMAATRD